MMIRWSSYQSFGQAVLSPGWGEESKGYSCLLQDSYPCGDPDCVWHHCKTMPHNASTWNAAVHCDVHEPELLVVRALTGINSSPAFASGVSVIFWRSALVCGFFLTHAQSSCQHSISMEIISVHKTRKKKLTLRYHSTSWEYSSPKLHGAEPQQK